VGASRPGPDTVPGLDLRRVIDHGLEALIEGQLAVELDELAVILDCSPHHLSRVFRRVTGQSLTAYRNRLRARIDSAPTCPGG
jgi:AraC-like DNA-binding protein